MLINGTVGIKMVGGVASFGISGSALLSITPVIAVIPGPNIHAAGQPNIGTRIGMVPKANVLHRGEVSINDPNNP